MIQSTVWSQQLTDNLAFFHSDLFKSVQSAQLFKDSKIFADAQPRLPYCETLKLFSQQRVEPKFNLQKFVENNFYLPDHHELTTTVVYPTVSKQINMLWEVLIKPADPASIGSLLPLKHPYIVPGGRFGEIYYWDSYFTALGLMVDKKTELVSAMLQNFIDLQQQFGCIPNGNRSYYLSRTQPPILALLVDLLLPTQSNKQLFLEKSVKAIENEYNFWMKDAERLTVGKSAMKRVVLMTDGSVLNRYWDNNAIPRPESYCEDLQLAASLNKDAQQKFYRNIRAACESGWDFSTRWLADPENLLTIQTTNIVPIDLNCLLYQVENKLSYFYQLLEQPKQNKKYQLAANKRKLAINKYLWCEQLNYFFDYNFVEQKKTKVYSLAATLALFTKLATVEQGKSIRKKIATDFLQVGGLVTTLSKSQSINSQQQWDSPNGWAPLQWFAVKGLLNYQYNDLATTVMQRWLNTVEHYYAEHDKLMEKYNVCQQSDHAFGGEYDVQEGFGWTNGVSQAFYQLLKK